MRRARLLLGALGAALALNTGAVYAETVNCTPGSTSWCVGTLDPDTIYGTYTVDWIDAGGAGDTIFGGDGNDQLLGDTNGTNGTLWDGPDVIFAEAGDDYLQGDGGSDWLLGGAGNDYIDADEHSSANPGTDTVEGGGGSDKIHADDGSKDVIDCGKGQDTVFFDRGLDKVADDCERKRPQ